MNTYTYNSCHDMIWHSNRRYISISSQDLPYISLISSHDLPNAISYLPIIKSWSAIHLPNRVMISHIAISLIIQVMISHRSPIMMLHNHKIMTTLDPIHEQPWRSLPASQLATAFLYTPHEGGPEHTWMRVWSGMALHD